MMQIIICDSNETAVAECKRKVEAEAAEKDKLVEVAGFMSCEKLLFEMSDDPNMTDLLIMNVDFGDKMDGLNAATQLRNIGYENDIVFLTENKERVFDSFEVQPLQYIPAGEGAFEKLSRALWISYDKQERRKEEYLSFACAGEHRNIALKNIHYFEMVGNLVEIHYEDQTFEFYTNLEKLENVLPARDFFRIGKKHLISMAHIADVKGSDVAMDNGDLIPIGKKQAQVLKERLGLL